MAVEAIVVISLLMGIAVVASRVFP